MSRILLVYRNPLFAHSIRSVLAGKSEHRLVGEVDDLGRVKAELGRLTPDIVIVESGEGDALDDILQTLEVQPTAWRVIAMQLDQPTMHIWSGASRQIKRSQDLLDALADAPQQVAKPSAKRPRRRAKSTRDKSTHDKSTRERKS